MENSFQLNEKEYFNRGGVDVMAFSDIYPVGHQSGVTVIMNGKRIAANGDIRFEQTPGQWQPVGKLVERKVDTKHQTIATTLTYPDMNAHLHGFNPMIYPDFAFSYQVKVEARGAGISVTVDLDREIDPAFAGKLCLNLELYPGELFGKPWLMDGRAGIFPRQPNGPTMSLPGNYEHSGRLQSNPEAHADREKLAGDGTSYNPIRADDLIASPYAVGHRFTLCPDDPLLRMTVISESAELKLYDGRMNHNNGWFVLSSELPTGVTGHAVSWTLLPHV